MFISNLYRNDELQDTVEVMVLDAKDERFFKSNGIQVDIVDRTYEIILVARNAIGTTLEYGKGTKSVREAYAGLARQCRKHLVTRH